MAHGPDQAIFGLGADNEATDIVAGTTGMATDAELASHAGTAQTTGVHGLPKVTVQTGEDETTTHKITCAGMASTDTVVTVLLQDGTSKLLSTHAGTLTAASGAVTPGTEANNSANTYIIFWIDKA